MSSRMRVTKGHSGNRRAHHKLEEIRLSVCSNCGAKHERHKVCLECGFYKGNMVMEVKKNLVTTTETVVEEKPTAAAAEEEK